MPRKKSDEVQKVKKKPRGKLGCTFGDAGLMLEKGDNAKYLSVSMEIFNLPPIDINNIDQVNKRINEYFMIMVKHDMKPTVTGFAMALGLDRRQLWELRTGNIEQSHRKLLNIPTDVRDAVKKTYEMMEQMWENYMQNGKINPVAGIFLGKNNYGYRDQTEYVLTPNSQKDEIDAEGIRKRYLQNPDVIDVDED